MQYYNKFYKMTYVKALNGLTKAVGKEGIDEEANKRIKEYLNWYNTQRHHKGLNYQTPLGYSLEVLNAKESNML